MGLLGNLFKRKPGTTLPPAPREVTAPGAKLPVTDTSEMRNLPTSAAPRWPRN